jgi:hypothetical protein
LEKRGFPRENPEYSGQVNRGPRAGETLGWPHLSWTLKVILWLRGNGVFLFHGARGGARKDKSNSAWKHGRYSEAARAERFLMKRLLKDAASLRKLLSTSET